MNVNLKKLDIGELTPRIMVNCTAMRHVERIQHEADEAAARR
jgi:hypothetical protein